MTGNDTPDTPSAAVNGEVRHPKAATVVAARTNTIEPGLAIAALALIRDHIYAERAVAMTIDNATFSLIFTEATP